MANTYNTDDIRQGRDRGPEPGHRTNRWTWIVLALAVAAIAFWALSRTGDRGERRMEREAPGEMQRPAPEQPAPR